MEKDYITPMGKKIVTNDTWSKEFDRLAEQLIPCKVGYTGKNKECVHDLSEYKRKAKKEIKQFISNLLSQERLKAYEEGKKEKLLKLADNTVDGKYDN